MIAPLSGIYLLKPLPDGSTPAIERVPLGSAAALLDRNLYRRRLSDHLGDRSARFGQIARLLATVPIYLFSRSVGVADNPRALDCLEAHWNTGR